MNNVIKRELEKVKAPIEYDDDTTFITIPKKVVEESKFEFNKSYLIKVEDYIINEPSNFTLSSNWNKGIKPKSNYLLIHVIQTSGKMLKVMARDFDIETQNYLEGTYPELWLPLGAITKIKELTE